MTSSNNHKDGKQGGGAAPDESIAGPTIEPMGQKTRDLFDHLLGNPAVNDDGPRRWEWTETMLFLDSSFEEKVLALIREGRDLWLIEDGDEPKVVFKGEGIKSAPAADDGQAQEQPQGSGNARTFSERDEEDDDKVMEDGKTDFHSNNHANQPPKKKTKGVNGRQTPDLDSQSQASFQEAAERAIRNSHANREEQEVFTKDGKPLGVVTNGRIHFYDNNSERARDGLTD